MAKAEWLLYVSEVVREHPDWLADTVNAAVGAAIQRSEDDAHNAWRLGLALAMLVEHPRSKRFRAHAASILIDTGAVDGALCAAHIQQLAEELTHVQG